VTSLVVACRVPQLAAGGDSPDPARELLREVVAEHCGVEITAVRTGSLCAQCGSGAHGRPYVLPAPGWTAPHVSLSRADGFVLVAVTDAGPVGVDVERIDAAGFAGFDDVALHPSERDSERAPAAAARARTWVRKESLLKALGTGLAVDPRSVRLSAPHEPPQVLQWPGTDGGTPWMYDLDVPPGYVAAATVLAPVRPQLCTTTPTTGGRA
jgi:4'-phosphopantetheinyl transferase